MLKKSSGYGYLYFAILLLSLHSAFTVYINSTFLSVFFTERVVSLLYMTGAIGTLLGLIASSSIIRRIGNFAFIVIALTLEALALFGLMWARDPIHIGFFFIIHQMLPPLLIFSLDIFVEGAIRTEKITGRIRSNYLTIANIAYVSSPFIVGSIVSLGSYQTVYLFSGIFICFLLILVLEHFKLAATGSFKEINFLDSIRKFPQRKGVTTAFAANLILHCFYAMMVIYTSIYLYTVVGFEWQKIGLLFTIMLLPFVIFEVPLGRLFDAAHIERDAIMLGFIIMSVAAFGIFITTSTSFFVWAALLFASRTGASFVEIGTEYAFFKRVSDRDAGFISIFRMTGPLSYILGPLIGFNLSLYFPLQYVFLAVSLGVLLGVPIAYKMSGLSRKGLSLK